MDRRPGQRCAGVDRDGRHEAIALPVNGLDDVLSVAIIPDRPAGSEDASCHRAFLDVHARPQALEQLLLGDQAVAVLHQMEKHPIDLPLQADHHVAVPKFSTLGVEDAATEDVDHATAKARARKLKGSVPCHSSRMEGSFSSGMKPSFSESRPIDPRGWSYVRRWSEAPPKGGRQGLIGPMVRSGWYRRRRR